MRMNYKPRSTNRHHDEQPSTHPNGRLHAHEVTDDDEWPRHQLDIKTAGSSGNGNSAVATATVAVAAVTTAAAAAAATHNASALRAP